MKSDKLTLYRTELSANVSQTAAQLRRDCAANKKGARPVLQCHVLIEDIKIEDPQV